jgi:hypothetical protein
MVDSGAVGGLGPLGDRHGPTPPHQERHHGQPAAETAAPRGDSAVVAAGAAAAFALLRERVLAATRRRALGRSPSGTPPAVYAGRGAAVTAPDAAAAIAAIENEQRWLAAGRLEFDAAALRGAFVEGLDETEAILREVAPGDAAAAEWFFSVRHAHSARVGPDA